MNHQHFSFDGCDTVELAKKYGTPLYIMSETEILARCAEIRRDFLEKYPNTRAVFASKAFQTLEICRIVTREGLGMDTVSGGEIYTAYKAGVPMENLYFHGNNKSLEEIRMAVDYRVGRVVVDNLYELEALNDYAKQQSVKMQILFRITPGVDSHTHKFISTGQLDSKFGIPLDRRVRNDYIKKAMALSHVELKGFHFHVGSQLAVNDSHMAATGVAIDLIRDVKHELGFDTAELNIGGGMGIHYIKGDERTGISTFLDPVMQKIFTMCKEYDLPVPQITIEPGRWIVGEAGITLYKIGSIKEIPDIRKYVGVDGGMTDNPRPGLYDAAYEAVIANKYGQPAQETVTIAGKCCESTDILIRDIDLPRAESGDILAVFSTGAYNYSMANHYNRIPKAAVVMVKEGKDRLIVRRETFDDLLAQEI